MELIVGRRHARGAPPHTSAALAARKRSRCDPSETLLNADAHCLLLYRIVSILFKFTSDCSIQMLVLS